VLIPLGVSAQNSKLSDSSVIKPCEQAIDELRVRRVEVEGLKQQIVLLQERDKLRDQYEANQAEQIAFWKTAATERKEALGINDRIEKIRMEQLTEYKDEIARLRVENDKLRRGKTKWFAAGLIGGVLIPKLP
jgi:predicted NBD/HSP70 family sugar kinase